MDTMNLETTEARQEAANELLDNDRYVYLKTKDVVENGNTVVCVMLTTFVHVLKECRLSVLVAIVAR
jgi:hypothetical protein